MYFTEEIGVGIANDQVNVVNVVQMLTEWKTFIVCCYVLISKWCFPQDEEIFWCKDLLHQKCCPIY